METLTNITIFLYMIGAAGYLAYLFIQKDYLQKIGCCLLLSGFVFHSTSIVYGFFQSGHIPVHNLNETLSISGWAIIGVFLWVQYKFHLKILGVYAAPLAAFAMVMASQFSREPAPIKNVFNSVWLHIHIFAVFIGEASFALACGLGILYLLQEHTIKAKSHGFFYKRLPSLELLDLAGYTCIIAGFLLLTLGLITGFVYAKSIWGRFWSWDPKEVWSGITWLLYAALLHQRLVVGWRGRKSAVMAILGFIVILFTFLGVNFLLTGHHEEFTRW